MAVRALFPTQIYEASLLEGRGGAALVEALGEDIAMLAEEDRAGRAWCRDHGYPGYTSYGSLNDLPRRTSAFEALKRELDRHVAAFAEALGFDLDRKPRLDSLWVNQLKPGGGHTGHIHPHSIVSGTVYVAVPRGAGGLKLEDPRLPLMMARPLLTEAAPVETRPFVYLNPQAGDVVLWESWLRHEVPAGRAKAVRRSVSFNYGI